jgi:TonB family protein
MIKRNLFVAATTACCMSFCAFVAAQSPESPKSNVAVYYEEDGIKPAALAPTDLSPIVSNDCKYRGAGIIRLSLVISPQGIPENITSLYPVNDDFDRAAIGIAKVDHFVPGAKEGVPVPVAQELEIKVTLCTIQVIDSDGKASNRLRLESVPVQTLSRAPKNPLPSLPPAMTPIPVTPENINRLEKMKVNTEVSPPVPLKTPAAEFPPDQRLLGDEGTCLISLVVDANGSPQAMRVVHGISEAFDEKALEAVAKYRFIPAKKNKEAIPTRMSIAVNFRLH